MVAKGTTKRVSQTRNFLTYVGLFNCQGSQVRHCNVCLVPCLEPIHSEVSTAPPRLALNGTVGKEQYCIAYNEAVNLVGASSHYCKIKNNNGVNELHIRISCADWFCDTGPWVRGSSCKSDHPVH